MKQPSGIFNTDYGQDMAILRTKFQWVMSITGMVLLLAVIPFTLGDDWLSKINIIGIIIIATLGINILTGYCGQINFGHAVFVASGAYISAILIHHTGMSWWLTVPISIAGTALIGLIFGLPALRIKGFYIAVTTLAAFVIVIYAILHGGDFTGGPSGLDVPQIKLGNLAIESERDYYYLIMSFLIICTFFAKNIVRGRIGRAFIAIRDNDLAAELMGINVFKYKLIAYIVCASFGAVSGTLYAAYYGHLYPDLFSFNECIMYLGYIIVGGLGSITGTFFGVIFLKLLMFFVSSFGSTLSSLFPIIGTNVVSNSMSVFAGLVIIIFILFEPRGLYHRWELIKTWIRMWPLSK